MAVPPPCTCPPLEHLQAIHDLRNGWAAKGSAPDRVDQAKGGATVAGHKCRVAGRGVGDNARSRYRRRDQVKGMRQLGLHSCRLDRGAG
jgi:hypothetical protein